MSAAEQQFEHEMVFASSTAEAQRIQNEIIEALQAAGFSEKVIFGIKLAIEEALVNAIKHGNQMDTSKMVTVRYTVNSELFHIYIQDEGPGFNPDDVPDPTDPENIERPCGRGLLLMRTYMTQCDFHPPGNICQMSRLRG